MKSFLLRRAAWVGAIFGATFLPLAQWAMLLAYSKGLQALGKWFSPLTPEQSVANFLQWTGAGLALYGAGLGATSASLAKHWLSRNSLGIECCLIAMRTWLTLVFLATAFALWAGAFALAGPLNAPLLWSIALAVCARVAANRVKRAKPQPESSERASANS